MAGTPPPESTHLLTSFLRGARSCLPASKRRMPAEALEDSALHLVDPLHLGKVGGIPRGHLAWPVAQHIAQIQQLALACIRQRPLDTPPEFASRRFHLGVRSPDKHLRSYLLRTCPNLANGVQHDAVEAPSQIGQDVRQRLKRWSAAFYAARCLPELRQCC